MDDTAQDPAQSTVPAGQTQQQVQAQPAGSGLKEFEPAPNKPVESTSEYVVPSESEPILHPEVVEHGVEVKKDVPDLTLHDKKAGLTHSGEATPVVADPQGIVQLPMTGQQASTILQKNKKTSESVVWLASMVVKHLRKIHRQMTQE